MTKKHIRFYSCDSPAFFLYLSAVLLCAALLFAACEMPQSEQDNGQAYDPDLASWKTASWSPFTVADTVSAFAYGAVNGADRYVAVSFTGIIGWSEDGDIWHLAEIPNTFQAVLNDVAFGNGLFVAVGNRGLFAWSENGEVWTPAPGEMTGFGIEDICGVAWGNGYFVAVGGDANISISTNGKNWKGCRDEHFNNVRLNDIAFDSVNNSHRFYVVGNGGYRGWTETDSLIIWNREGDPYTENFNWNPRGPEGPFNNSDLNAVTAGRYGNGPGIGVVFGNRIAIATNINFSGFDADLEAFLLNNNQINGIAWGGGYFVIAGRSAMIGHWNSAEPSINGSRIWTALSFSEFKRWEITALEACNGRFYIGGIGGRIGYSK